MSEKIKKSFSLKKETIEKIKKLNDSAKLNSKEGSLIIEQAVNLLHYIYFDLEETDVLKVIERKQGTLSFTSEAIKMQTSHKWTKILDLSAEQVLKEIKGKL